MATPAATALSVKRFVAGVRSLGFRGSSPHLWRDAGDESLHLVHVQRSIAGVTGRDPGYTVNLAVLHGAVRRAQRAAGLRDSGDPPRVDAGEAIHERLGIVAFGFDRWWHPSDDAGAEADANEAIDAFRDSGLPWLEEWTDPRVALDRLLSDRAHIPDFELAAALMLEEPPDPRRVRVVEALAAWIEDGRAAVAQGIDISSTLAFRESLAQRLSRS